MQGLGRPAGTSDVGQISVGSHRVRGGSGAARLPIRRGCQEKGRGATQASEAVRGPRPIRSAVGGGTSRTCRIGA